MLNKIHPSFHRCFVHNVNSWEKCFGAPVHHVMMSLHGLATAQGTPASKPAAGKLPYLLKSRVRVRCVVFTACCTAPNWPKMLTQVNKTNTVGLVIYILEVHRNIFYCPLKLLINTLTGVSLFKWCWARYYGWLHILSVSNLRNAYACVNRNHGRCGPLDEI